MSRFALTAAPARPGRPGPAIATAIALILAAPIAHAAGFPNERWNVSYVEVQGPGDAGLKNALNLGLSRANRTYFYGSKPAKMRATLAGEGRVDVEIVAGNQVLARRSGLGFSGTGADATRSIQNAALAWLDDLACTDGGCAFARAGGGQAPASPPVAVATAPEAEAEPAPVPRAEPEPAAPRVTVPAPDSVAAAPEQSAPARDAAPAAAARVQPAPDVRPAPATQPDVETAAVGERPAASPSLADPALDVARAEPAPRRAAAPRAEPEVDRGTVRRAAPAPARTAVPDTGAPEAAPDRARVAASDPAPGVAIVPRRAPRVAADAPDAGAAEDRPAVRTPAVAEPAAPDDVPGTPAGRVDDAALARGADTPDADVVARAPDASVPEPSPGAADTPIGAAPGDAPRIGTGPDDAPEAGTDLALAEPDARIRVPVARGTVPDDDVDVGAAADGAVRAPGAAAEPAIGDAPADAARPAAGDDAPAPAAADDGPVTPPTPITRRAPPAAETDAPRLAAVDPAGTAPDPADTEGAVARPGAPEIPDPRAAADTPAADTPAADPAASDDGPEIETGAEDRLAVAPPVDEVPTPRVADPVLRAPVPRADDTPSPAPDPDAADAPAPDTAPPAADAAPGPAENVETDLAAVDPGAAGPTLANARWIGFTPAVYTGSDERGGAWISGPFDRRERVGWITDTATGATTRVRFIWREGGRGGQTAQLSREAAARLGLGQGDVANVAVYLPR